MTGAGLGLAAGSPRSSAKAPAFWGPRLRQSARALLVAGMAALGVARAAAGFGWGLLPLLAVGPGLAAAAGGVWFVLGVGGEALAVCGVFLAQLPLGSPGRHMAAVAGMAVAGVTAGGALATVFRARREQELARARGVAEAMQRVVLRPAPRQVAGVRFAARYLSASQEARIGGDLYDVVATPGRVRLVVGDAQGKGLEAVASAAATLGVFRDAAHQEKTLADVADRIDASLAHQFGPEQFVTAIFAEVTAGGQEMTLLNCGHPVPILAAPEAPRLAGDAEGGLPLGLGLPDGEPHPLVTVPFGPGSRVLFYTDGISEARDKVGEFFPLLACAALRSAKPPATLADRLAAEMTTFAGHAPNDDVALLIAYRDSA